MFDLQPKETYDVNKSVVSISDGESGGNDATLSEERVVPLSEEQRQATVMALAHLAVERPSWDTMLTEIAAKMDTEGDSMYQEFKRFHSEKVINLGAKNQ